MSRETIIQRLIDRSQTTHKDGYVSDIKDNLISTVSPDDFINDLNSGSGNELDSKFKAIYSSSALGVNFFGFFKHHLDKFSIFGENSFILSQFEKKLATGLKGTSPNLDFYLENDNCIIGFESKFLELLTPKQPNFSPSYSDSFLSSIDKGLPNIVNYYRINNSPTNLDSAQLIKHSIGLLNNKGDRHAKLIYVYWEPLNPDNFVEYKKHRAELADFTERMKILTSLSFHHLTYTDFYNHFCNDNLFKEHLSNFKDRYLLKII